MHNSSYSKMEWFKNTYLDVSNNLNILDVGSLDYDGNFNYSTIFDEKKWKYTGLDIEDGNNVDIVVTDIYNWFEIEDNEYDVIISGQYFEHLEFFWLTMSQIERVLKPGGYVCIIVPSDGPKHGTRVKNCYKFFEEGIIALAKYVGLEVLHTSVNNDDEAQPWNDVCLVAHKEKELLSQNNDSELEDRISNLENKLNSVLNSLNNK